MDDKEKVLRSIIMLDPKRLHDFISKQLSDIEKVEDSYRERAKFIFDALSSYPKDNPQLTCTTDSATGKLVLRNPDAEKLDEAIKKLLNHRTIGYLIEFILNNHESAKQSANALKKHHNNHMDKQRVFEWCNENMPRFSSMDEAAMDIAETFVPQKFRTVRGWLTEWKKLHPTGTA